MFGLGCKLVDMRIVASWLPLLAIHLVRNCTPVRAPRAAGQKEMDPLVSMMTISWYMTMLALRAVDRTGMYPFISVEVVF